MVEYPQGDVGSCRLLVPEMVAVGAAHRDLREVFPDLRANKASPDEAARL